jgi:hypothetical protein
VCGSPVGSPSQSMSVLGQHVGSRCAFLPAAHQRAKAGPPAHGGRPSGRLGLGLGGAAPSSRRGARRGQPGRARSPPAASVPVSGSGVSLLGPAASGQSALATRARTRRGPWSWAAGPAPALHRGRRGSPGPNRRRCHWQVAGPAPREPGRLGHWPSPTVAIKAAIATTPKPQREAKTGHEATRRPFRTLTLRGHAASRVTRSHICTTMTVRTRMVLLRTVLLSTAQTPPIPIHTHTPFPPPIKPPHKYPGLEGANETNVACVRACVFSCVRGRVALPTHRRRSLRSGCASRGRGRRRGACRAAAQRCALAAAQQ